MNVLVEIFLGVIGALAVITILFFGFVIYKAATTPSPEEKPEDDH